MFDARDALTAMHPFIPQGHELMKMRHLESPRNPDEQQSVPLSSTARALGAGDNQRLNAMSDGVFSIVITVMAFSIRIPDISADRVIHDLPQALEKLLPDLVTLIVGFIILGIYWIGHNNVFTHIIRHDRALLWLNIFFLMSVATIPFPTMLVVRYGEAQLSIIVYAINLIVGGVLLDVIWWYASNNRHLMCESIQPQLIHSFHRRILTGPLIYLIAIGVSFVSMAAAKLLFVAAVGFYLVPTAQDFFHHRQLSSQD
jgi:uncharacterized membrane protein